MERIELEAVSTTRAHLVDELDQHNIGLNEYGQLLLDNFVPEMINLAPTTVVMMALEELGLDRESKVKTMC